MWRVPWIIQVGLISSQESLKCGRGQRRRCDDGSKVGGMSYERDSTSTTGFEWRKEAMGQARCKEAGKGEEMDSLLEPPERNAALLTLWGFAP